MKSAKVQMQKKRHITSVSIIMAVLMLALICVACGSSGSSSETTQAASVEEDENTAVNADEGKSDILVVETLQNVTEDSVVPFSMTDDQVAFINGHLNLFPADEEDMAELESYIDSELDYAHMKKNPQKYSGTMTYLEDLLIVETSEDSAGSGEYDYFTVFNVVDPEGNPYWIYYIGKSIDVVENDSIRTIAMPLDYTSYENINGDTVSTIVMIASIVEDDTSPELLADFTSGTISTSATSQKEKDIDYTKAYSSAFNGINRSNESGDYILWDLNDDGIQELILEHGVSSADYTNDVWTLDDDGNPVYLGEFGSIQTFYQAPDGDGLYAVYGHMGHEIITRVSMDGDKLTTEVVSDKDLGAGEDYYSSEAVVAEADLDDKSLLERYSVISEDEEEDSSITTTSSNGDYILPDSDSRYYSDTELSKMSKDDLRKARNEIYARHGRIFDSADLDEYFRSKSWYEPTIAAAQFNDNVLNDYEKANARTIQAVENPPVEDMKKQLNGANFYGEYIKYDESGRRIDVVIDADGESDKITFTDPRDESIIYFGRMDYENGNVFTTDGLLGRIRCIVGDSALYVEILYDPYDTFSRIEGICPLIKRYDFTHTG